MSNSGGNNVRLMDRAVVPGAPYTPDVRRNLLMGSLAGLLLALGFVMAIDYLDDTVKTPEDITRRLKLPFLGLVPAVKGNTHPLLSHEVPHEFGEAFRALRTSLVFSSGAEERHVIALTSAQPLEGKTTTACNMAADASTLTIRPAHGSWPVRKYVSPVMTRKMLNRAAAGEARSASVTTKPAAHASSSGRHTSPNTVESSTARL